MVHAVRLGLHAELDKFQQEQAARIYLDEQNWSPILNGDFATRGLYPHEEEEALRIIVADAEHRDGIFPYGQMVLLQKREQHWKTIGSIHTVIASEKTVKESFQKTDSWNAFNTYGRLSKDVLDPEGKRWVCFAIQTDPHCNRKELGMKPADTIIQGVRVLAFSKNLDYEDLQTKIEISQEIVDKLGTYQVDYINPLTRLSGFFQFTAKYPKVTAYTYALNIEKLVADPKPKHNAFDSDLREIAKRCSLRYHLSRGAALEQVIEKFRIHDTASMGYGASVLYKKL